MTENAAEVSRANQVIGGRTISDLLNFPVQRGFLKNLSNNRTLEFLLNPAQFEDSHAANYSMHGSPGLSHRRLQYTGNENVRIPMDLIFDEIIFRERRSSNTFLPTDLNAENRSVEAGKEVERHRRILMEFQYPRKGKRLAQASPPPLLFHWPGMFNMRVRLFNTTFRYLQFQVGKTLPRVLVASILLVEDPLERIFSENMVRQGTFRSSGSSNSPQQGAF